MNNKIIILDFIQYNQIPYESMHAPVMDEIPESA